MSDFPLSQDDLLRLARLVEKHDLSELVVDEDGVRVSLKAEPIAVAVHVAPSGPAGAPAVAAAPARAALAVEAPIMGVFYRSPAPGEPPFVEIGDTVEVGQPVGMIEAMKVFSEVLAEVGGRVLSIAATNGALVQPGEPLILLEAL